jgi:FKBP-type peptidyl-prolyl cis-trans isomerase
LENPTQVQDDSETPLLRGNKKMLALENEDIELFIKRYKWNMIKTGTGLRYEIVEKGTGSIPKKGDAVELEFVTQLLTGDTIYTSKERGVKKFQVEKTDEIVGLHEAVQLIPKGSVAYLVIPSYMAYGIAGDGDQIFGQHALVMTIKILNK